MVDGPAECNIKVICRVRPLNELEEKAGSKFVIKFLSEEAISIAGKNFTYDKVFRPDVNQEEVYNVVAKPIVKDVLSGYNGTIFAYGQTASGKTHTMEGELGNSKKIGIIPRIISDIFGYIYQMNENIEFHIKVSYFEIYMDKIRDLLDVSQTNLSVHEDKNRVPYVKGATERFVASPEEVLEVIEEGKANRHVAVTNMNEHSSRSHSVFLINVKQVNIETEKKLSGKLYLVDLAGSEKVSKTGAEGSVLDEAKNINKSLSALGNVIAALADCAGFIPYRDSKLTRILQESLGGNARTTMIICCSPASFNETETKSTLLFGSRAKTIKNNVMINEELTAEEWKRRYEKEREKNVKLKVLIDRCEAELARWRNGETVPENERLMMKDVSVAEGGSTSTNASSSSLDFLVKSLGNSGGGGGSVDAQRLRWEEEKAKLYQQLDDKDEELNVNLELLDKYKEQIAEAEDQIKSFIRDRDSTIAEINRLQSEKEASNMEIKEVFQALSELAQNYDQKLSECAKKKEENDCLVEDLEKKRESFKLIELELQQMKEMTLAYKKKIMELNNITLKELSDIAGLLGSEFDVAKSSYDKNDEDGGLVRLAFNKLKTGVKIIVQKSQQQETSLLEATKKAEENEKDLSSSRLQIQQLESRMKVMMDSMKEIEIKKRSLESQVDELNEECSQLKTKEQLYMVQLGDLEKKEHEVASTTQMKLALERQMELHHEQHHKQLTELRDQIEVKERRISELTETSNELNIALKTLQTEHASLVLQDSKRSAQMQELVDRWERREQASVDLKSLEDNVAKELQALHTLRKLFVKDIYDRVKKTPMSQEDDESIENVNIQKQKIVFLESNLDQLTKVHKQLVRDNADLRCELPKMEKRLRATLERIRALEAALKEAKEGALRDRKKYQQEVDRIKEAVRQKTLLRKGHSATIVKPIRAGHAPQSFVAAGPSTVKVSNEEISSSNISGKS